MTGLEMMLANIVQKAVANLPPEIKGNIDKIGATVLAFKAQMDRIEANQQRILQALNLPPEIMDTLENPKGLEHGKAEQ